MKRCITTLGSLVALHLGVDLWQFIVRCVLEIADELLFFSLFVELRELTHASKQLLSLFVVIVPLLHTVDARLLIQSL